MSSFVGTKNSEVRYSIIGWAELRSNFTIDPVTGELKPRKPLNYESISKDNRLLTSSVPINIKVCDTHYSENSKIL